MVSANSSTNAGGLAERGHGDAPDEEGRQPRHDLEVLMHEHRDRRSLHLHDDVLTRAQPSPMHLRDRRGCQRLALERREHRVQWRAQLRLHDGPHVLERLGRHLVAELLELTDQFLGKQPFTAADDLSELDVGRTQPLGRDSQTS